MLKTFPIEFVKEILEQELLKAHFENPNFFGGKNQINILSFYEQLKNQEEVNRFVETVRELSEQQNRTNLIGNGIIVAPENPSITNLYSSLIVPMNWTCSIRCALENRDQMIITINNLIENLKGRKVDIAQLNGVDENNNQCSTPFIVGTIGENDNAPAIRNGDYLGSISNVNTDTSAIIQTLSSLGVGNALDSNSWFYVEHENKLKVVAFYTGGPTWYILDDDRTRKDVIFPPEHTSFEKYKVSLSFDAIRCDEPRTLNSKEYCEISFGGSATLVNNGVKLGNDLIKIKVSKYKIPADTDIVFSANAYYLEPLEMPSGNNINTNPVQLVSNLFKTNAHADAIALTLQYTFIVDESIDLLDQWYDYARYGTLGTNQNQVSPNLIYRINEYYCSWGNFKNKEFFTKVVGDMDIENTESDTITISLTMQIQGENN